VGKEGVFTQERYEEEGGFRLAIPVPFGSDEACARGGVIFFIHFMSRSTGGEWGGRYFGEVGQAYSSRRCRFTRKKWRFKVGRKVSDGGGTHGEGTKKQISLSKPSKERELGWDWRSETIYPQMTQR